MPVLITAALSPEAYRLQRILNADDVVFADESPLPQLPGTKSLTLPAHNSGSFIHETLAACLDHGITRLYPLKWGEVLELSGARTLFAEYSVKLMIPSDEWLAGNGAGDREKASRLSVLENGRLIAGDAIPDNFLMRNETGVFTWATPGQKMEYKLYLVSDAGI